MRKTLNIPDMEPDEWEIANEDKQCDQHFQELMDTCKIPPDLQDHLIHEDSLTLEYLRLLSANPRSLKIT